MNSYIRTADHITVVFEDGETATVYASQENFSNVLSAVKAENWEQARRLAIPSIVLKETIADSTLADRVVIEGGVVHLDGQPLHNTLTIRMIQMANEGFNVAPISAFLVNLMDNPSFRAVNELYTFMEKSDLPITPDGHFIAYKRVSESYRDMYSGKIDNSIGATPSMPRNMVDEDASRTCSQGLHFCSRSYLPSYGNFGACRTVIVKINPRDVVAIPIDYNNAKGRCCRYEVIGELEHRNEDKLEGAVYGAEPEVNDWAETTPVDDGEKLETRSAGNAVEQVRLGDNYVVAVFASPSAAQLATHIDSSSIAKVCRGERNSAGGFGWQFVEEQATDNDLEKKTLGQVITEQLDDLDELDDDLNDEYDDYQSNRWFF